MKSIKKRMLLLFSLVMVLACSFSESAYATPGAADTTGIVVVVIDPGHGGSDTGNKNGSLYEKNMALVTAQAMYEELLNYGGVLPYLTRTDDTELSVEQRVELAGYLHADLLVSIHYSASAEHQLHGVEAWIPSEAPCHAFGYQFGSLWNLHMGNYGFHMRGIKTRAFPDGGHQDIVPQAMAQGLVAVALEHGFLDAAADLALEDTEEKMRALGRLDALAVAQYFGLKRNTGEDYRNMSLTEIPGWQVWKHPVEVSDAPEICTLTEIGRNAATGEVTFQLDATDSNEALQYFDYSIDGGKTFRNLSVWPGYAWEKAQNEPRVVFTVVLPRRRTAKVVARVYNGYDVTTRSNEISIRIR
ncbi:MAG: N-acetylmuramoyl-L-alanine amidase [Lachnospiraceae bacterium]|nr:N-acetylmuramoyl-L-alanine amidase [Lachnospiraceae bacterium]MBR1472613.1 N-acetylmuramoyl-L-alanine amidase [Lachnospiraceae bacterium]